MGRCGRYYRFERACRFLVQEALLTYEETRDKKVLEAARGLLRAHAARAMNEVPRRHCRQMVCIRQELAELERELDSAPRELNRKQVGEIKNKLIPRMQERKQIRGAYANR